MATANRLHVALIDDHQLLLDSLERYMLRYDFIEKLETYKNPKDFLVAAGNNFPDVIICDIMMPAMNGIDFIDYLRKAGVSSKIIVLSSIGEAKTIRHALRIGANGFLGKDTTPDELADAVLAVCAGDNYIGESLRNTLIRNTIAEEKFVYSLSRREKEVLNHVCSGKTIKEAAYEMELSINTVQAYYKSVLKKFNINRTADLIVFAMQNGLYNPPK